MVKQGAENDYINWQVVTDESSVPSENSIIKWIDKILHNTDYINKKITIRVVGAEEGQTLNKQYRAKDYPTNVLSFPSQLPQDIEPDYLGDVVICASVVAREAAEQGKTIDAHWAHMLVHGILHLQGYDHQNDQEAEEMEIRERVILSELGYADPYLEGR